MSDSDTTNGASIDLSEVRENYDDRLSDAEIREIEGKIQNADTGDLISALPYERKSYAKVSDTGNIRSTVLSHFRDLASKSKVEKKDKKDYTEDNSSDENLKTEKEVSDTETGVISELEVGHTVEYLLKTPYQNSTSNPYECTNTVVDTETVENDEETVSIAYIDVYEDDIESGTKSVRRLVSDAETLRFQRYDGNNDTWAKFSVEGGLSIETFGYPEDLE